MINLIKKNVFLNKQLFSFNRKYKKFHNKMENLLINKIKIL